MTFTIRVYNVPRYKNAPANIMRTHSQHKQINKGVTRVYRGVTSRYVDGDSVGFTTASGKKVTISGFPFTVTQD